MKLFVCVKQQVMKMKVFYGVGYQDGVRGVSSEVTSINHKGSSEGFSIGSDL